MPDLTPDTIREALSHVSIPGGGDSLIGADLVKSIVIRNGAVGFAIEIKPEFADLFEPTRAEAERLVQQIPGVKKVTVVLTAHNEAPTAPAPSAKPHRHGKAGLSERARKEGTPKPPSTEAIPGIAKIIAVASGKGGVGKSTVAVNLAIALSQQGKRVGLLDADIYGPSMPRMLGLTGKPESDGKKLQPMTAYGLKVMSMGFLVDEDTPMIWRGPMVMSAVTQMLKDVDWGELDVLVVDMPPGTGDAQLTLVQRVPVAGAVIVSTPQEIALIDARKGLAMFERVGVKVFGMVENMAWFEGPDGSRSYIFGEGGVRKTAEKIGANFLGEVPLYMEIRETSDAGTPITASAPDSKAAAPFVALAKSVAEML